MKVSAPSLLSPQPLFGSGERQHTLDEGRRQLLLAIAQLALVFEDKASQASLCDARISVEDGAVYPALRRLRDLLPQEDQLIQARRQ